MDERLKRRLVGAMVLVSLAVIFLPMLFEGEENGGVRIETSNIPPQPVPDEAFRSRILPEASVPLVPPRPERRTEPAAETGTGAHRTARPGEEAPQPRVGLSTWVVQVASLSNKDNADKLVRELKELGYSAFLEQVYVRGKNLYRIRVGPEIDRKRAERMVQEIHDKLKIKGQVIRYP